MNKLKHINEEMEKYFEGPVSIEPHDEEKEESTADSDDEDRVNDLQENG